MGKRAKSASATARAPEMGDCYEPDGFQARAAVGDAARHRLGAVPAHQARPFGSAVTIRLPR